MDQPIGGQAKVRRSKNGCRGCRRIRRKCDEQRPSCGRCVANRTLCSYQPIISWGGRAFRKSAFGKIADIVPVKVEDQSSDAIGELDPLRLRDHYCMGLTRVLQLLVRHHSCMVSDPNTDEAMGVVLSL